ncbi:MAG: histidine kinase, partial [Gaiellaceae bacterium]
MSEPTAARLAWSACGLSLLLAGGGIALHVLNYAAPGVDRNGWWGSASAGALGFAISGAPVASRHRSNPIGWIFLGLAFTGAVDLFALEYGIYALGSHPGSLAGGTIALWVASWIWTFSALMLVVFLLFPDGRLPSRRWRPVLALAISLPLLHVLGHAVYAGPIREPQHDSFPSVENPLGISAGKHILTILGDVSIPFVFATILACLAALVVRFRRTQTEARQQIKWVAYGSAFVVVQFIVGPFVELSVWQVLNPVAIVLFTAALGIALVRYRLYDIDLIVNRTLVYAALSGCLVGAYSGTVALLGALVQHAGFLGPLLATGLVAVLFAPLRLRLQRGVDRLLYGQRREPYEVIAQLGERLEETPAPGRVLPTLVETVARALKLPYAAIELRRPDESFETAASYGSLIGEPLRLPLAYQNAPVGRLVLGPRRAGGRFSRGELRLFEDISRQAGIAAYAVQLTTDLQRSRGHLVSAREEERRRLRRDLHDELGPQLAGVGLQLEAARKLVRADPAAAEAMLDRLVAETQSAIAAIRRLAYELRP